MLLRLQRYGVELIYRKGTEMVLANTLSRAFPLTAVATEFSNDVAALSTIDAEQTAEMRMIASTYTLALDTSAAQDHEYVKLQQQICQGWPDHGPLDASELDIHQPGNGPDHLRPCM